MVKKTCIGEKCGHLHLLILILIWSNFFIVLMHMKRVSKDRILTLDGFLVHIFPL